MARSILYLGDLITKELLERMKQQGSKYNVTSSYSIIISTSRVIPTLLYFLPGPPKRSLRRQTVTFFFNSV